MILDKFDYNIFGEVHHSHAFFWSVAVNELTNHAENWIEFSVSNKAITSKKCKGGLI